MNTTTIRERKILASRRETLEQQAERLFPEHVCSTERTTEHNRSAWLRAVQILGAKWRGKVHDARDGIVLFVAGAGALPFLVMDILEKLT